jgi:hypothetical protein
MLNINEFINKREYPEYNTKKEDLITQYKNNINFFLG